LDLPSEASEKPSALIIWNSLELNAVGRFLEHEWRVGAKKLAGREHAALRSKLVERAQLEKAVGIAANGVVKLDQSESEGGKVPTLRAELPDQVVTQDKLVPEAILGERDVF
jgi:hypothetical protein